MRVDFKRGVAMLAMVCWLLSAGQGTEALAKGAHKGRGAKETIMGKVVDSKGQPVAGARVHFAHHRHHKHHAKGAAKATATKAPKIHAKGHHHKGQHRRHGAVTGADGSFTLHAKQAGKHHLVAHKKGVGSGRASVAGAGGQVVIKLHKHHHHRSTQSATHRSSHRTSRK